MTRLRAAFAGGVRAAMLRLGTRKHGEGMADQGGYGENAAFPGDPQPTAAKRRADIGLAFNATRDAPTISPTPGPLPELLDA